MNRGSLSNLPLHDSPLAEHVGARKNPPFLEEGASAFGYTIPKFAHLWLYLDELSGCECDLVALHRCAMPCGSKTIPCVRPSMKQIEASARTRDLHKIFPTRPSPPDLRQFFPHMLG